MVFLRRWSRRSKLLAVLAVVSGASSFWLVRGYADRLEALRPAVGDPVPVVVAARPLVRGSVLDAGSVRLVRIPSAYAPPGAIGSLERAVGRTLVSDLAAGEAVTRTRVAVAGGPVAALVPAGLRAFALRVGLPPQTVRSGDRVDVLATFGGPRPYTQTVASGLEVLTIVQGDPAALASGGGEGAFIVLLVSPDTAERLAYATAFADVSVALAPAPEGAPDAAQAAAS